MSNYLAVATVTAALAYILDPAKRLFGGLDITFLRPSVLEKQRPISEPAINIFLHRVLPNPMFSNADLPTRSTDGALHRRPMAALDLDYVLSFYGDDVALIPQRLLGWAETRLHARPTLTRDVIVGAIDTYPDYVGGSDLADQVQLVNVAQKPTTMDELARWWSVFFETPFLLSVAYQASVVLMTPTEPSPPAALPVREVHIYDVPIAGPLIARVTPEAGPSGSTLDIYGRAFFGPQVQVTFPDVGLEVNVQPETADHIRFDLPLELPAGALRMGIVVSDGGAAPVRPRQSNLVNFLLQPSVDEVRYNAHPLPPTLSTTVSPPIDAQQTAVVWLQESSPPADRPPRVYGLPALARSTSTGHPSFDASPARPGTYRARLQVDTAQSPERDQPEVVIP